MALYSTVSPVVMQRTSSSSSASDLTLAGKSHFTPPLPHPRKVEQGHLSTQTHTLPSTQKHHNNAKILGRRRFRRNPNFLRPLTTLWWVVHTFGRNSAGKLFLITEMSSESKKKKKTTNAWHRWATSASYQNFRHFPKSPLATEATPRLVLARVPQNPGSKCQRVDRQDYKIQSAARSRRSFRVGGGSLLAVTAERVILMKVTARIGMVRSISLVEQWFLLWLLNILKIIFIWINYSTSLH